MKDDKYFDAFKFTDEQVPFEITDSRQERHAELEMLFERHFPKQMAEFAYVLFK
jgi:hypothetical protein